MPMSDTITPRVNWRFAALCAAVASVLFGTQNWINAPDSNPMAYSFALERATIAMFGWLALAPWIFRAGAKNPLGTEARMAWIWRHLWLATVFAVIHSLLQTAVRD